MNSELEKYIKSARDQRVSDQVIREQLLRAGWQVGDIDLALTPVPSGAAGLPIAPIAPVPHFGMWVAFQYILFFITILVCATALAEIFHFFVAKWLPDSLEYSYYFFATNDDILRIYMASLMVSFPIFATLFIVLKRQALKNQQVKNLRTRKILVYATLIITFMVLLTRIINNVYKFLGGVAVAPMLAHAAVTFIVSGSIFIYFILDIMADRRPPSS